MEHLACYLPGNLALGVAEGAVSGDKAAQYLAAARSLTATCWRMYSQQQTGDPPLCSPESSLSMSGPSLAQACASSTILYLKSPPLH